MPQFDVFSFLLGAKAGTSDGSLQILEEDVNNGLASLVTSASGNVASFPDGADDLPVVDLKVSIRPSQAGSGDPSPSNVRPISGWTGAKVWNTGRNLFDYQDSISNNPSYITVTKEDGKVTVTASNINWGASNLPTDKRFVIKAGVSYKLSGHVKEITAPANGYKATLAVRNAATNQILVSAQLPDGSTEATVVANTFTPNTDYTCYFSLLVTNSTTGSASAQMWDVQLEAATNPGEYEPYAGGTHEVSWQTEAGTVYGGTLDVTTGVLTVTHGQIASYAGETLPGEWISDRDVYAEGASPTTGAQVVYALATPVTYQLTPTEVKTLLGENNLWVDCGPVTVEYRADPEKYVEKRKAQG